MTIMDMSSVRTSKVSHSRYASAMTALAPVSEVCESGIEGVRGVMEGSHSSATDDRLLR